MSHVANFIDRRQGSAENARAISKHLLSLAPNIISHRAKYFAIALTLAGLSVSGESMAGGRFSNQGNALSKALLDELMRKGVCTDNQSCSNATQMYREDGDRIYLNMYGQTDPSLGITVARFILENGLRVADGMPITLRVYSTPKSQEVGSIFRKKVEIIKLEVNK